MSQENVETIRRAFHAFNERDVDAMLANWADDVENLVEEIQAFKVRFARRP